VISARTAVLDTSALIALYNQERGASIVRRLLSRSAFSSVNLAEIATKMTEWQVPSENVAVWIRELRIEIVPFDRDQAMEVGALRQHTHPRGLSLGDRACLVLGRKLNAPVYTSERAWADINVGVRIELIR
jgi:ribonuclease VapC